MFGWIKESNRLYHFWFAIPCGFLLSILFVLGLAIGMEFKDCQLDNRPRMDIKNWTWRKWDWLDILATLLGGLIGQLLQIILISFTY